MCWTALRNGHQGQVGALLDLAEWALHCIARRLEVLYRDSKWMGSQMKERRYQTVGEAVWKCR